MPEKTQTDEIYESLNNAMRNRAYIVDKLFDLLANDQRVIVSSDRECGYFVTWNRSATLQLWDSNLDEVGIRTLSYENISFVFAAQLAIDWLNEIRQEGKYNTDTEVGPA
jgi:hypothetical protein